MLIIAISPQIQVTFTDSQLLQLRSQIMAFKMLCRNQPISEELRLAVQGKRAPDMRRGPLINQRINAQQWSNNSNTSMQGLILALILHPLTLSVLPSQYGCCNRVGGYVPPTFTTTFILIGWFPLHTHHRSSAPTSQSLFMNE